MEHQSAQLLDIPAKTTDRSQRPRNAIFKSQVYDPAITYQSWSLKSSVSGSLLLLGLHYLFFPAAPIWADFRAIVAILCSILAGLAFGYAISARNLLIQMDNAELNSESVTEYKTPEIVQYRTIAGNTGFNNKTTSSVRVEWRGVEYTWQPTQVDAMRQRHLSGQRQARDPLGVTGSAWGDVQRVMQGLGHWSETNMLTTQGAAWIGIEPKGGE